MAFFSATITGVEQIEEEYNAEIGKINALIPQSLQAIASQMADSLKYHLEKDFYRQYTPAVYEPRDGEGSYAPLNSESYMDTEVKDDELTFLYEPSGAHKVKKWHTRDGDNLIIALQRGSPPLMGNVPSRPFWNNFVREQELVAAANIAQTFAQTGDFKISRNEIDFSEFELPEE